MIQGSGVAAWSAALLRAMAVGAECHLPWRKQAGVGLAYMSAWSFCLPLHCLPLHGVPLHNPLWDPQKQLICAYDNLLLISLLQGARAGPRRHVQNFIFCQCQQVGKVTKFYSTNEIEMPKMHRARTPRHGQMLEGRPSHHRANPPNEQWATRRPTPRPASLAAVLQPP